MVMKVFAALAAIPICGMAVVAGTGVLIVDVKEGGPDGHHIVVPVPLLAAQAAARFVPSEASRIPLPPEMERYLPAAERLVAALADAPDGELVRVDEKQEQVVITKVGRTLQIEVHGPKEDVSVLVPLTMVSEVLGRARDGRLAPADVVAALRQARLTKIADVRDGGDHVQISIW
jgi:hypothetical protein